MFYAPGGVSASIVPERPALKLHFNEPTYADESFAADTGQFTQFSIGGIGSFAVTGGQGVVTDTTGSQKDRFVMTGSAIVNPIGWFQVDVAATTGVPNNFSICSVGIAKDASNSIFAEHDGKNNETRITVRIGGVSTTILVSQTVAPAFKLALSVFKNHLVCFVDSGAGWIQKVTFDVPASITDLTTLDLSAWFTAFGASCSNNATCTWTFDNLKAYKARAAYFELQPTALITINEQFVSDTGQWTKLTGNTASTFSIVSGQGVFDNSTVNPRSDFFLEGADVGMPQVCSMIDVVAQANSGGTPTSFDVVDVGIMKDVNNFICAHYNRITAAIYVRVAIAGVFTANASVSTAVVAPFKMACSIVANRATIWLNAGNQWVAVTSYDFTSSINFKTASTTGWKGMFGAETNNNSKWTLDNFKVGRFGSIGLRDQTAVTDEDGTPHVSGRTLQFSGTGLDPNGTGYMGVFTLDLDTYLLSQSAVVMTSRGGAIQNDLSGQIVRQANGDRRLLISSWGNGFSSTLSVLLATTSTDILTGANIVAVTALTLPAHAGSPGGEYDPFLVKIGSTYYLAYTVTTDTSFAGNPFFAALASSTDLSTWAAVGADSGNTGFEGTKIIKTHTGNYVMVGGHTTVRVYDFTLTFLGLLDLTTDGGTDTFPHPMMIPDGTKQKIFTFDDKRFAAANFTWGNMRTYTAPRYK